MASQRFVEDLDIPMHPATQGAVQADAKTSMGIIGEIKGVILTRGSHKFQLDALVTEREVGDVLGGEPFLELNDIAVRPAKKHIIIKGREIVSYQPL